MHSPVAYEGTPHESSTVDVHHAIMIILMESLFSLVDCLF